MRAAILSLVICSIMPSMAQTGPAGVGTSTNNVLWLSADRNVWSNTSNTPCTDGQNVRQWGDRSGNGKLAEQATSGQQPSYETNEVNAMPVVRYTSSQVDRLLATGISTGNQASIWAVVRYTSLPSSNPGILQGTASGNGYSTTPGDKNIGMWVSSGSPNRPWGRGIQSGGAQIQIPQSATTSANNWYIINNSYDGTNIIQYVNNTASGSVGYDGTLRSWTDMAIGTQAGTENWNGDLAEVIAYNTSLNIAQRIIVANYLSAKYGLTLGTNDVYSQDDNGFDFDVAGIGRVTGAAQSQTTSSGPGIVQVTNPTNLGDDEFLMWGHDNGTLGTWGQGDLPTGLQGRWNRTWRVSERNTTNSGSVNVGNVDMGFDLSGFTIGSISHIRLIVDTDGDGDFSEEAIIGPPTLSLGRYWFYGVSTITNADRFTLGTTSMSGTMLPIELLSFEATAADASSVHLRWATASEHDNDHFTIERSENSSYWQPVADVEAIGNSLTLTEYATNDMDLAPRMYYYRLRQTDIDGTSTVSDVVAVDLARLGDDDVLLFPNPSTGSFQVSFATAPDEAPVFALNDALGRAVAFDEQVVTGTGLYTLHAQQATEGVYQLRIQVGDAVTVRKARIVH